MQKTTIHIVSAILFFLQVSLLTAQNDRIHYVEKGETVYAIARKYQVSPKKILQLNPNASDLIQIGQELIIPNPSIPTVNPTASLGDYDYYYVEKGDTKFGLSQKFNISIAELESINPNMVPTLLADTQIRVPKVTTTSITNTEGLKTHYVQKGETLYGIARMYGITLDQLIDANLDRLGNVLLAGQTLIIPDAASSSMAQAGGNYYIVQKGDTKFGLSKKFDTTIGQLESLNPSMIPTLLAGDRILIPDENNLASQNQTQTNNPSTENSVIESAGDEEEQENQSQNTPIVQEESSTDVSYIASSMNLFVPFSRENLKSAAKDKNNFEAQFVRGATRAIDSLRSQGYENLPDFIYAGDTLETGDLGQQKIILTPSLNQETKDNLPENTLAIVGRSSVDSEDLILFENNSANDGVKTFMLDHVVSISDNVILINDLSRVDYSAFAKARHPQISILTETPTQRINEVELEKLLKTGGSNYVVFNTNVNGVMINVTNSLLKLSSKYDIKTAILDKKYLPKEENVSSKRFRILKMTYPESSSNANSVKTAYDLGFETTYDAVRKLRSALNTSDMDVVPVLKGNKMEALIYRKVGERHYQSGTFEVKSY